MPEPVLVTEREFRKSRALFESVTDWRIVCAPPEEDALAAAVLQHACRAVIVGVAPYRGPLYEALSRTGGPRGALLARHGVGHQNVDKRLARRLGIVVTNTPGVLEASVAEHAMWLLGCLAKDIARQDARLRGGEFSSEAGIEIAGKTLGILGFGAIGRRLARLAHFGFGMRVAAMDVLAPADFERHLGLPIARILADAGAAALGTDADAVLAEADFVSLHVPDTPATRHLIDADRLQRMKPGAFLINTARGAIVDERALYDALAAGRLAGAGLDVFDEEPYRPCAPDRDLRKLANVLLTPHAASNTREANARIAQACLGNVAAFFGGRNHDLSRVE